jgi:hypothetical protein
MDKVHAGELMVVGAFYEISSGIVDFFHEVSVDGDELAEMQVRKRGGKKGGMKGGGDGGG